MGALPVTFPEEFRLSPTSLKYGMLKAAVDVTTG